MKMSQRLWEMRKECYINYELPQLREELKRQDNYLKQNCANDDSILSKKLLLVLINIRKLLKGRKK